MSEAEKLSRLMAYVYQFNYNKSTYDILVGVYGEDQSEAYMEEKSEQIKKLGFGSWFCNLDLQNRRVVAKMIIERYNEVQELLK